MALTTSRCTLAGLARARYRETAWGPNSPSGHAGSLFSDQKVFIVVASH